MNVRASGYRLSHRDTRGQVVYCDWCGCPLMTGDQAWEWDEIGVYCSQTCVDHEIDRVCDWQEV